MMQCPHCEEEILGDTGFCSHCGARYPSGSGSQLEATRTMSGGWEELAPGTIVGGKFRIGPIAGRGGMGIVYRADDLKLHRTVALKFLAPDLAASPESRDRFVIEARAAAALSHPHICTIHEIYDREPRPFLEMEFVEGQSLRAMLRGGPLPVREAVEVAIQIAEGLEEAHQKGVIHRDLKSSNVLVTDKGQAKIMDFGLAKVRGETLYTKEGTTLGTAAYMSPEQARGEPVDQHTDLWSLGVVLYEMVSGHLPFGGGHEAPILYAVVHEEPKALGVPVRAPVERVIRKALQKEPEARYASAAEMARDLRGYLTALQTEELGRPRFRWIRRPRVAVPALLCLLGLLTAAGWWLHRQSRIRWAREVALPEVERIRQTFEPGAANLPRAYRLALEAERYLGDDPALREAIGRIAVRINIRSEPAGAAVHVRLPWAPEQDWQFLGLTPIEQIRIPRCYYWWRFEKEGYAPVLAVEPTFRVDLSKRPFHVASDLARTLDRKDQLPPGMVRVQGAKTTLGGELEDFFVDRYEVSNRQFKEFVTKGAYQDRRFWKHEFVKDGKPLSWEQAIVLLVDQSGRPGPSTWIAGDYPPGQDNYPVSGVSWYEAAAYAEFSGKALPTVHHWGTALGMFTPLIHSLGSLSWLIQRCNFSNEGLAPVGTYQGVSAYGAYDMGGNVREWCWNPTGSGRAIRGGAWNDNNYMAYNRSQADPFDRSPKNGFRCARYLKPEKVPAQALAPLQLPPQPDVYQEKAVPDQVFQVYKALFDYDRNPLNATVELRRENPAGWIMERISFDAAYSGERVAACLFLPRSVSAPYQAVIYFPGSLVQREPSSKELDKHGEYVRFLSFIVKNGRAAVFPVYYGTFERQAPASVRGTLDANSRQEMETRIRQVQDFRRCVDYLETRPDFNPRKFAFVGMSWGGMMGPIIQAVDNRLAASVLVIGGARATGRPEVNPVHYIPRAKQPTLMLNGRYDMAFPFETAVKPLYDLLGTPAEHKRLRVYETDHFVPHAELIKETLAWLDRYLGPVR